MDNVNKGIGIFIVVAITVIIGLVLLQASAPSIGQLTTKASIVNESFTFPKVAGGTYTLASGQAADTVSIVNSTGFTVPTTNYTITNYVVSNGVLTSVLTATGGQWNGNATKITYTYEPYGYDTNSGGRAIASLVLVFFALGIAAIVFLAIRNDVFSMIGS